MAPPIFYMAAGAPRPVAPFSPAVEADGWVFVTGQMPNLAGNEDDPLPVGIDDQTRNVFSGICNIFCPKAMVVSHFAQPVVF